MKTYLLDTNVLIRFLRQDHPAMGAAARQLFQAASRGEVRLVLEEMILAETVYMLQSHYKQGRSEIAAALQTLLRHTPSVYSERPAILHDALERYRHAAGVDFADAWLAALAAAQNLPVASFDRDFDQFTDMVRFEPPVK